MGVELGSSATCISAVVSMKWRASILQLTFGFMVNRSRVRSGSIRISRSSTDAGDDGDG